MNLGLSLTLANTRARRVAPAPSFVAVSTGSTSGGIDLIVTTPPAVRPGDVLMAVVQASGTDTFVAPQGWTLVSAGPSSVMFQRIHGGAAQVTFQTLVSSAKAAVVMAWRDVSLGRGGLWNESAVTAPTPPAILVPAAESFNVVTVGATAAGVGYNMPQGWTKRAEISTHRSIAVFVRDARVSAGNLAGTPVSRTSASGLGRAMQASLTPR